ncbi:MAG TPA: helix-turn-helix transcriptional regulator [Egibacteraceae bacterium]
MPLTSGIDVVDELVDGVRVGDNLVVQAADGVPLELFAQRCIAASRGRRPVVVCNVASPWEGEVPTGVTLLDWHPVLSGEPSAAPGALPPGAGIDAARAALAEADETVGSDAVFVIDTLTAVQQAWGAAAALDLFLWACPRLFRRRSVALWTLEREQHQPSFLRRLTDITQVVVTVARDGGDGLVLEVVKAAGRPAGVVGRTRPVVLTDRGLEPAGPPTAGRLRLGTLIRTQRAARGLGQAELARMVGISPSALSQVERGVRGLSAESLVRIWAALGVPFGPTEAAPYTIARRGAATPQPLADGLRATRLVREPGVGTLWWVVVDGGASGRQPPFAVKATEVVTVVRGVVDVEVAGRSETLQEGDVLVASEAPVSAWGNPASTPAEVLWLVADA